MKSAKTKCLRALIQLNSLFVLLNEVTLWGCLEPELEGAEHTEDQPLCSPLSSNESYLPMYPFSGNAKATSCGCPNFLSP